VFQVPYSALQREHEELITVAAPAGAGTLIRGGAARAPLAKRGSGVKSRSGSWMGKAADDGSHRACRASRGHDRLEFVLRFTLTHPDLSSTIVGTANMDHLRSNLAIGEKGPLAADFYQQAKRRLEPAGQ
jgi:aryl-alcohol dehydrogenase-like predicted oxidoreductase